MIAADLANTQVWVATTPIDMRKSFDGLAEVVRSFLGHDPLSGSLFVCDRQSKSAAPGAEIVQRWDGVGGALAGRPRLAR